MSQKEKALRAAEMLRSAGIKSAQAYNQVVQITPEDAMKVLLITEEDVGQILKGEQRIRDGVKSEIKDLQERLARLAKLANHSPELCAKGKHIMESYATGGRSGHCVTRCLACDYRQDGYD